VTAAIKVELRNIEVLRFLREMSISLRRTKARDFGTAN
jgi:hypothetical protein